MHYPRHFEFYKTQYLVHGWICGKTDFDTAMLVYILVKWAKIGLKLQEKKALNLDTPHTFWFVQWVDNIPVSTLQKRILKPTIKKCTFFRFCLFFLHAPHGINCAFYQAEKFSEVDKTRIKKKKFLGKIYSQLRKDLKSSNPVSDLHTRIAFNMIIFVLFWQQQFWCQNQTSGRPSRRRVCNKTEEKRRKKNWRNVLSHSWRGKRSPSMKGWFSLETVIRKNSLLGGGGGILNKKRCIFFPKKNKQRCIFFPHIISGTVKINYGECGSGSRYFENRF